DVSNGVTFIVIKLLCHLYFFHGQCFGSSPSPSSGSGLPYYPLCQRELCTHQHTIHDTTYNMLTFHESKWLCTRLRDCRTKEEPMRKTSWVFCFLLMVTLCCLMSWRSSI